MSRREFLLDVRTAMRFFGTPEVTADSPRIDTKDVERTLERAALWLTPGAVRGFNPRDFPTLSDEEKQQLSTSVDAFRQIAEKVPPDGRPTVEQIRKAGKAFQQIVRLVSPDLVADEVERHVGRALRAAGCPEEVIDFDYQVGIDSMGQPIVWVYAVLKDEVTRQPDRFREAGRRVRAFVEDAFAKAGIDIYPHVSLRSFSEREYFYSGVPG